MRLTFMTNFNWYVDGPIVLIYLLGTVWAGLWIRRFVHKVDDFLVAGRNVNLYLGIASLAASEFGIATCMANAELGFKYGFALAGFGMILGVLIFVAGQKLTTSVPVTLLNEEECVGVKLGGGDIFRLATEIEVTCLPQDLPDSIEVDMLEIDLNDTVHLADITAPKGVEFTALEQDNNMAIVIVSPARLEEEEEDADQDQPAEAAEDEEEESNDEEK